MKPYLLQYAGQQLTTGPQAEAYAFSVFGEIALWAGIAAFILAVIMAVLVGFGFWHARRTSTEAELLVAGTA